MPDLRLYPFELPAGGNALFARFPFIFEGRQMPEISCALSLSAAGTMALDTGQPQNLSAARRAFFDALKIDGQNVYFARQTHSRNIVFSDEAYERFFDDTDGFVSGGGDDFLAVTVADCLPVLLYDTRGGAFAAVHSGWQGTGIAGDALRLMMERCGTKPECVAVVLGPCICGDCYEVDAERAGLFERKFGGGAFADYPLGNVTLSKTAAGGETRRFIDLRAANAALLAAAGVRNIAYCVNCTFSDSRLGSYRREGAAYTKMLAVIGRLFPH